MRNREEAPRVIAGSMADIAFLLLIFFLVTTSLDAEAGLDRMLPPIDHPIPPLPYQDKNILLVRVNQNNGIMVENEVVALKDLRTITSALIMVVRQLVRNSTVTIAKGSEVPLPLTIQSKPLCRSVATEKQVMPLTSPYKTSWWVHTINYVIVRLYGYTE